MDVTNSGQIIIFPWSIFIFENFMLTLMRLYYWRATRNNGIILIFLFYIYIRSNFYRDDAMTFFLLSLFSILIHFVQLL